MRPPKRTSFTCLTFEALKEADDFLTLHQLNQRLGIGTCRVSAALHHLYKRKAVSCLSENGTLWWYATPETDDRTRSYDEVSETQVRRKRKPAPHPRRKSGELPKR